ncbi:MAG: hypothetical protein RLP09_25515 [Sandaracinaceae bacterium]
MRLPRSARRLAASALLVSSVLLVATLATSISASVAAADAREPAAAQQARAAFLDRRPSRSGEGSAGYLLLGVLALGVLGVAFVFDGRRRESAEPRHCKGCSHFGPSDDGFCTRCRGALAED